MKNSTKPQKPNDGEGREGRKGCGCCLNVLAIGGLILAVLITVGIQWALNYVEKEIYNSASTNRAELDVWLKGPIKLPDVSSAIPELVPTELKARLTKLEKDVVGVRIQRNKLTTWNDDNSTMPMRTGTIYTRIFNREELTTSDTLAVDDLASASRSFLPELHAVLGDPQFKVEPEQDSEFNGMAYTLSKHYSADRLDLSSIQEFIALHLAIDQVSSATDLLSSSVKLIAKDPPDTVSSWSADTFMQFAKAISVHTSKTEELSALLGCMKAHRATLLNLSNDISFTGSQYVELAHFMVSEGFLPRLPVTRAEYLEVQFRTPQFVREVSAKYGEESEQARRAFGRLYRDDMMVEAVRFWPLHIGMRLFSSRIMTWLAVEAYSRWKSERDRVPETTAEYDLLTAQIALGAALADGKDILTEKALTPTYLEVIPSDPYNRPGLPAATDTTGTKTLRYSPENKWFYSVGPDGRDASGDEIIGTKVGKTDTSFGMI